jgi:hypothetical protein
VPVGHDPGGIPVAVTVALSRSVSSSQAGWVNIGVAYGGASHHVSAMCARVIQRIRARLLPRSFGGRPGRGAHHALATLNEIVAGSKVGWVLEADLKNFFESLSREWLLRFVVESVIRA